MAIRAKQNYDDVIVLAIAWLLDDLFNLLKTCNVGSGILMQLDSYSRGPRIFFD
jgi:hypothetical protein